MCFVVESCKALVINRALFSKGIALQGPSIFSAFARNSSQMLRYVTSSWLWQIQSLNIPPLSSRKAKRRTVSCLSTSLILQISPTLPLLTYPNPDLQVSPKRGTDHILLSLLSHHFSSWFIITIRGISNAVTYKPIHLLFYYFYWSLAKTRLSCFYINNIVCFLPYFHIDLSFYFKIFENFR